MDTPQITPTTQPKNSGFSRVLLFGSILIIAVVSVALAITLPKTQTEDRSKAASSGACIGQVAVAASSCNGGCSTDSDCMSGTTCYKTSGATEGVCRNPSNPTSTTCGTTPSSTPIAACTKTCTFNYDCNLSAGETCVGTNANNGTASVTANAPRAATSAELASLASDQTIFMSTGNASNPDSTGKMTFSVISKKSGTFVVKIFDIIASKGSLDPQKLILSKSISIGANQVVTGTVVLPRCGRYQVDYASSLVTGTKYDLNTAAHYFWGTVFEIPCQSGCCQIATNTAAATTSPVDLVKLSLIDPTTGKGLTGFTALGSTATVTASTTPSFTIGAVSFPNSFPNGVGSVKFEVNGATARIDSSEPYTITDGAMPLQKGTYTVKATLYSQDNGTGTTVDSVSTTLTIK